MRATQSAATLKEEDLKEEEEVLKEEDLKEEVLKEEEEDLREEVLEEVLKHAVRSSTNQQRKAHELAWAYWGQRVTGKFLQEESAGGQSGHRGWRPGSEHGKASAGFPHPLKTWWL